MCPLNGCDDSRDVRFERNRPEALSGDVNHQVAGRSTGSNVSVRSVDQHIVVAVQISVFGFEPA